MKEGLRDSSSCSPYDAEVAAIEEILTYLGALTGLVRYQADQLAQEE